MATKKEIITKAAVKLGYEGDAPKTTAQAIDALAVALGGTASGGSIAEATKALVAAMRTRPSLAAMRTRLKSN